MAATPGGTALAPAGTAGSRDLSRTVEPGAGEVAGSTDCLLRADFLKDLAVPDNTALPPETAFSKSWQLRNDGDCPWDETYALTFVGGSRMDAPKTTGLRQTVLPGGTIDLTVDMTTPAEPGTYQGFWKLQDPQGRLFGVGENGHLSFWVKIQVLPGSEEPLDLSPAPTVPDGGLALPSVMLSGTAALPPGIAFDLDQGKAREDEGADIFWGPAATAGQLENRGSARIGLPLRPATIDAGQACSEEVEWSGSIDAHDLQRDAVVCYLTDEGRTGNLVILDAGDALRFDYTTYEQ